MIDTLKEHLKKASKAQKDKYSHEDFSKWGNLSLQKRTAGMTPEEKKEYFRKIRAGIKVSQE